MILGKVMAGAVVRFPRSEPLAALAGLGSNYPSARAHTLNGSLDLPVLPSNKCSTGFSCGSRQGSGTVSWQESEASGHQEEDQ